MQRHRSEDALEKARAARQEPSVAETLMWKRLRGSKTGFKFRREHPIGVYRLDFFCVEAMLAVEMDGEQHDPDRDSVRDQYMLDLGILTYRIPNVTFFGLDQEPYVDQVAEIVRLCEKRSGRNATSG